MPSEKTWLRSLDSLKRVHIVGVGGTLMGAFAAFLKRSGIEVTGSDQVIYPPMSEVLKSVGITPFLGYDAGHLNNLPHKPDLVIIGNVVSRDNPEAQAAISGHFAYTSLPEAMQTLLLKNTSNLVVAGTHGKTTTSSLLAFVLSYCGKKPNYFIGGVCQDLPFSFHVESLEPHHPFVLEGDEYDTAFWDKVPKFNYYIPDHLLLTSVEYDHADIYPDFASVLKVFDGLVLSVRPEGHLIACIDYLSIKNLILNAKAPVFTYGITPEADYFPKNIRMDKEKTCFEIFKDGKMQALIKMKLSGEHNILNALAVWIECEKQGLDLEKVVKAFEHFSGVKRRQEVVGTFQNILIIDDFAHHPTAVHETLKALKFQYPERRLLAVFEPRSATSRRKIFQKEYAAAFGHADLIFISTPYDQSKIPLDSRFSSEELREDFERRSKKAFLFSTVEEGVTQVSQQCRSGDLVVVLSNGGFGGFIPKIRELLQR